MTIHRLRKCVESDYDALNAMIFDKIKDGAHLVTDIVSHISQGGGKQLRPLVVLLSSHACGYKGTQHIELAAMVEFLHTATLLHDDVIDESKMCEASSARGLSHPLNAANSNFLVVSKLIHQRGLAIT